MKIKQLLGFCPYCHRWLRFPKRFRMVTKFVYEESNYDFACKSCRKGVNDEWRDQWRDVCGYTPIIDGVED